MLFELLFLFGAGFFGGVLNSVAGGGSFITFPALIFVGINPICANATNTFASSAGYLSGAYAFRQDLYTNKKELPRLIISSVIGGFLGAWLLLTTPEAVFSEAIPWLLLFATVLFIFGEKINAFLKQHTFKHRHSSVVGYWLLVIILLGVCIYGGFFNAGLGIVSLSYLALAGHTNMNAMNGMKLLISSLVSLTAIVIFIYKGSIVWYEGFIVMFGTLTGGYLAAHIAKGLAQQYVRCFVIFISCGITLYFFIK